MNVKRFVLIECLAVAAVVGVLATPFVWVKKHRQDKQQDWTVVLLDSRREVLGRLYVKSDDITTDKTSHGVKINVAGSTVVWQESECMIEKPVGKTNHPADK